MCQVGWGHRWWIMFSFQHQGVVQAISGRFLLPIVGWMLEHNSGPWPRHQYRLALAWVKRLWNVAMAGWFVIKAVCLFPIMLGRPNGRARFRAVGQGINTPFNTARSERSGGSAVLVYVKRHHHGWLICYLQSYWEGGMLWAVFLASHCGVLTRKSAVDLTTSILFRLTPGQAVLSTSQGSNIIGSGVLRIW